MELEEVAALSSSLRRSQRVIGRSMARPDQNPEAMDYDDVPATVAPARIIGVSAQPRPTMSTGVEVGTLSSQTSPSAQGLLGQAGGYFDLLSSQAPATRRPGFRDQTLLREPAGENEILPEEIRESHVGSQRLPAPRGLGYGSLLVPDDDPNLLLGISPSVSRSPSRSRQPSEGRPATSSGREASSGPRKKRPLKVDSDESRPASREPSVPPAARDRGRVPNRGFSGDSSNSGVSKRKDKKH